MIKSLIYSLGSGLGTTTITIIAVVLIIVGVLALIKRVIKIAVVILGIAVVAVVMAPVATKMQDKYAFNIDSNIAYVKIDGEEYKFDMETLKKIQITENGDSKDSTVNIQSDGKITSLKVPNYIAKALEKFSIKNNIPVE